MKFSAELTAVLELYLKTSGRSESSNRKMTPEEIGALHQKLIQIRTSPVQQTLRLSKSSLLKIDDSPSETSTSPTSSSSFEFK